MSNQRLSQTPAIDILVAAEMSEHERYILGQAVKSVAIKMGIEEHPQDGTTAFTLWVGDQLRASLGTFTKGR